MPTLKRVVDECSVFDSFSTNYMSLCFPYKYSGHSKEWMTVRYVCVQLVAQHVVTSNIN